MSITPRDEATFLKLDRLAEMIPLIRIYRKEFLKPKDTRDMNNANNEIEYIIKNALESYGRKTWQGRKS